MSFDLNPPPEKPEPGITLAGLLALALVCATVVAVVWLVTR